MRAGNNSPAFWSRSAEELLRELETGPLGISTQDAQTRLVLYGRNAPPARQNFSTIALFLSQFRSPVILILIAAALLSLYLHDPTDAAIILSIVLISGILGFFQERGAHNAVQKLLALVQIKTCILRDKVETEVPLEEVVPGDVVVLDAGDVVPGDSIIIDSNDLFIDEAALTGETYPVEKMASTLAADTPLASRSNSLWMGTHVVSGTARALIVHTGTATEFGQISERLRSRPQETEFELGVKHFGYFLMEVTLILVIAIFAVNVLLEKPVLESFLFSLALAVGLTPQLLPAIITINLSHGARKMAEKKVIVKRLAAIENFGSMNVLCSDKTGTLTEGIVHLHSATDIEGNDSPRLFEYAFVNASLESGFSNPIDDALRASGSLDISGYRKLGEIPYDFIRKRLSVLVSHGNENYIISKGALSNVLDACAFVEVKENERAPIECVRSRIEERFRELSSQGLRTLGVAWKNVGNQAHIETEDEKNLVFLGFLVLSDPPKAGILDVIRQMRENGVGLRIITGDNRLVAATLGRIVGVEDQLVLTGSELQNMTDEALVRNSGRVSIFAEIEPNQKERIISALRKAGNVVGYIGDGINDAPALHAADVSISVDSAVDVAKEAADIVLLEKDLAVLLSGIAEGRRTFANTLKYIFMATSANFGNMFSMAGASLFLPFLPLLPKQILLANLMTDFPEMTIASDSVDPELVAVPRRMDIGFIRRFMLFFGLLSSVFDYITFGVLLFILDATPSQFQTGWFIESVISAAVIVLVVRTRKPFYVSRPGRYLLGATVAVILAAALLPYTPLRDAFDFEILPPMFLGMLVLIVAAYVTSAEAGKRIFYRNMAKGFALKEMPRA